MSVDQRAKSDVLVATLSPGMVNTRYMDSILGLLEHDRLHHKRILTFLNTITGPSLGLARNGLVDVLFGLRSAQWLLQIDSDMVFPPDALDRILSHADPESAPIVGAACSIGEMPNTFYWPNAGPGNGRKKLIMAWPPEGAGQRVKVDATGAAFLLTHRSVFEKIPYPWFIEREQGGLHTSEDLTFCIKAGEAGFPVFVAQGIDVGHVKTQVLEAPTW